MNCSVYLMVKKIPEHTLFQFDYVTLFYCNIMLIKFQNLIGLSGSSHFKFKYRLNKTMEGKMI